MDTSPALTIRHAERLGNSVIIFFGDGNFGVFSADLLRRSILPSELRNEADFIEDDPPEHERGIHRFMYEV